MKFLGNDKIRSKTRFGRLLPGSKLEKFLSEFSLTQPAGTIQIPGNHRRLLASAGGQLSKYRTNCFRKYAALIQVGVKRDDPLIRANNSKAFRGWQRTDDLHR